MTGSILTINDGSSSLKFALFDNTAELTATVRGEIEDLDAAPHLPRPRCLWRLSWPERR